MSNVIWIKIFNATNNVFLLGTLQNFEINLHDTDVGT